METALMRHGNENGDLERWTVSGGGVFLLEEVGLGGREWGAGVGVRAGKGGEKRCMCRWEGGGEGGSQE